MMSKALISYALLAAIRDRLFLSLIVCLAVGASLSFFLGDSAISEKDRFTLVFAASGMRIIVVFALVLFVVFFIRRSFDSKDIEFLLTRPVSRVSIVLSYALAFLILSIFVGLCLGVVLFFVGPHLFSSGHFLWLFSVMIECIIMVNLALFFSMYISSAVTAVMASFGVYVLGRLMGQFLGIIDAGLVDENGPIAIALQTVSVITPRLDLLGQSSWLLYGADSSIGFVYAIFQGVVFSALVLSAASFDFLKRQF